MLSFIPTEVRSIYPLDAPLVRDRLAKALEFDVSPDREAAENILLEEWYPATYQAFSMATGDEPTLEDLRWMSQAAAEENERWAQREAA
jgi:hypothetical protein